MTFFGIINIFSSIYKIPNHSFSWHILKSQVIQHHQTEISILNNNKKNIEIFQFCH